MNTTTNDNLTLALLAREVRYARNNLLNAIILRKQHPSYGYTKAEILATFNRLVGLLQAYNIVSNGESSASASFDANAAAEKLDIDIEDLRTRAKAA